jgi:hypothetical protein
MRKALLAVIVCISSASAGHACRNPSAITAIVHSRMPESLPPGAMALIVEVPLGAKPGKGAIVARVRKVVAGRHAGDWVRILVRRKTSCSYPFANGRSGLLVGYVRPSSDDGMLVVDPIEVSRRNGFRLVRPRHKGGLQGT